MDEWNKKVKEKIIYDFVPMIRKYVKSQVFDVLDKKYDFPIPSHMIEQESLSILSNMKKNREFTNQISQKDLELQTISKRKVKLGLILAHEKEKENIHVQNTELQSIVNSHAKQNPQIKDKILKYYSDKKNIDKIKNPILEEKILDSILKKIQYTDVKMKSDDFLKIFNKMTN